LKRGAASFNHKTGNYFLTPSLVSSINTIVRLLTMIKISKKIFPIAEKFFGLAEKTEKFL
jgi:hypothetical protein